MEAGEDEAALVACVALHVVPDRLKPAFRSWRDAVLRRFETHFAFDPSDKLGKPVPVEALSSSTFGAEEWDAATCRRMLRDHALRVGVGNAFVPQRALRSLA